MRGMGEKAVVDRFEGSKAVLLLDDGKCQLVVPRSELPVGTRAGAWLQVDVKSNRLVSASLDPAETERVRKRIDDKLARLRRGDHLRKG